MPSNTNDVSEYVGPITLETYTPTIYTPGVLTLAEMRDAVGRIMRDTTIYGSAMVEIKSSPPVRPKVKPYLSNQGTEAWY